MLVQNGAATSADGVSFDLAFNGAVIAEGVSTSHFTIKVNGTVVALAGDLPSVSLGSDRTVTLPLVDTGDGRPDGDGEPRPIPARADDHNAIEDLGENDAKSFTDSAVTQQRARPAPWSTEEPDCVGVQQQGDVELGPAGHPRHRWAHQIRVAPQDRERELWHLARGVAGGASATSYVDSGLSNGDGGTFQIRAHSSAGAGLPPRKSRLPRRGLTPRPSTRSQSPPPPAPKRPTGPATRSRSR